MKEKDVSGPRAGGDWGWLWRVSMNSPGLPNFHHREGVKDLVLCLSKSCVIAYQQDTNNKALYKTKEQQEFKFLLEKGEFKYPQLSSHY